MTDNKMGTMPIKKLLLFMAMPAIFSMLVQALYNIVDSVFVAYIGQDALTAVSLAFPIQGIVISCCTGLGIGVNSLIARKLGERNKKMASNIAEHGLILFAGVYVLLAILGFVISDNFIMLFTSDPNTIQYGRDYIFIIMVYSFGMMLGQVGMSILQGTGDMKHPMMAMIIGAVSNIILDPIFIFGYFGIPAMGVKGAAIATVLGQIISMVYIFIILFTKEHHVKFNLTAFKWEHKIFMEIMMIGVPSVIIQGIMSVMLIGMNFILSAFGDVAIAVMGAYFRIQSFVFMAVFGLCQGLMPIVSFNYGARNNQRLKEVMKISIISVTIFMFLCLLLFETSPWLLLKLFNGTTEMIEIGIFAFRAMSLSFPFAGVIIILSVYFQSTGNILESLVVTIVCQIGVLLPAYLFGIIFGLKGVWFSFPVIETIGLFLTIYLYLRLRKSHEVKLSIPLETELECT